MPDYSTVGGLRTALAKLDRSLNVYIDNLPPSALSSYRGYYEQLAIERSEDNTQEKTVIDKPGEPFDMGLTGWGTYTPGSQEVRIKRDATVAELIKALDLAIGAAFEGYKGGQFVMYTDTELWVSEYSRCDRLRISHMEVLPGRVDFGTTEEEW